MMINFKLQVPRIMWKNLKNCQRRCFNYLFERFKQYYLPVIFPNYSLTTNIYKPTTGQLIICSKINVLKYQMLNSN